MTNTRKPVSAATPGLLLAAALFVLPTLFPSTLAARNEGTLQLRVSLEDRQLTIVQGGDVVRTYDVAVGKDEHPTPTGTFLIRKIVWNPRWVPPPGAKWAKGKTPKEPGHPDNPMKRVKIFFKEPDYYIHGTGDEDSLGSAASHGCIRMSPKEASEVARYVMEHGGEPRNESWFRRIFRSRSTKVVLLRNPVTMQVQAQSARGTVSEKKKAS